jgi:hypothetical protein
VLGKQQKEDKAATIPGLRVFSFMWALNCYTNKGRLDCHKGTPAESLREVNRGGEEGFPEEMTYKQRLEKGTGTSKAKNQGKGAGGA